MFKGEERHMTQDHDLNLTGQDSLEAVQRDVQAVLNADPDHRHWSVRVLRDIETLLVRVVRLPVLVLILLLSLPAIGASTKDEDEDWNEDEKTESKNKTEDKSKGKDEPKTGPCPRGGDHTLTGKEKVTRFPIYGKPGCFRVLRGKTCSKCKSDVTYSNTLEGKCDGPMPPSGGGGGGVCVAPSLSGNVFAGRVPVPPKAKAPAKKEPKPCGTGKAPCPCSIC
jgi:hypothetical protein